MSHSITSIADVEHFLAEIPMFKDKGASAAKFGLEGITAFCEILDNPQKRFPSIHVAGTNGKGTVCHLLASVYQEAGFKTGLYTSPHLQKYNERFKINGIDIADEVLVEFFSKYGSSIKKLGITYFEISTGLAFWYFAKSSVDLAIIETGLGGRLDATNVIHPMLSVITSIGLDHTDVLGDTIGKIASEKAGIIKDNVPVIIGALSPEAKRSVEKKAAETSSKLYEAQELLPEWNKGVVTFTWDGCSKEFNIPLMAPINALNSAMVYESIQLLKDIFNVTDDSFAAGLANVLTNTGLKARFERLFPNKLWFYDGAHNQQALQQLVETIKRNEFEKPWVLVFSVMKDKLTKEFKECVSEFDELYYFSLKINRAACFDEVSTIIPSTALFDAKTFSSRHSNSLVIFSGSFYFYESIIELRSLGF